MSVYKTKSGIWRIQFYFNGKNYIRTSKTKNKKAAQLMEAQWRSEIHARRYLGEKAEISVQTLIDDYLKLPLAGTTIINATIFFKHFTEDVDCKVNASEFDQAEILKFVQKRLKDGIAQSTVTGWGTHLPAWRRSLEYPCPLTNLMDRDALWIWDRAGVAGARIVPSSKQKP